MVCIRKYTYKRLICIVKNRQKYYLNYRHSKINSLLLQELETSDRCLIQDKFYKYFIYVLYFQYFVNLLILLADVYLTKIMTLSFFQFSLQNHKIRLLKTNSFLSF